MSKKSILPQTPHHVVIYDEDWDYLETRFGPRGIRPIGVSAVIKKQIHKLVLRLRDAENRAANAALTQPQHESTLHARTTNVQRTSGGVS